MANLEMQVISHKTSLNNFYALAIGNLHDPRFLATRYWRLDPERLRPVTRIEVPRKRYILPVEGMLIMQT
jgi:hypothetical protein